MKKYVAKKEKAGRDKLNKMQFGVDYLFQFTDNVYDTIDAILYHNSIPLSVYEVKTRDVVYNDFLLEIPKYNSIINATEKLKIHNSNVESHYIVIVGNDMFDFNITDIESKLKLQKTKMRLPVCGICKTSKEKDVFLLKKELAVRWTYCATKDLFIRQ